MAIDFTAFDKNIDLEELQKEVEEAPENNYTEVPAGNYIVALDKMEITLTKKKDKVMFAVQCGIKEGEYEKRKIFFNRVISGNKNTEKWNDGRAIKSVCTWVNNILNDDGITFVNYSDFADQILDAYQDLAGNVELDVYYDPDNFNPITVNEVYDI